MLPENGETKVVPRFQLEAFTISKSLFELVSREAIAEGETRPPRVNVGVQINAHIQANSDVMRAIVTLDVLVTPDRKWQPYRIEVTVAGGFHGENVTFEQFDQFCKVAVPPILFPYVREVVHRITMDAPNGVVRMDPINVGEMLSKAAWAAEVPPVSTEP